MAARKRPTPVEKSINRSKNEANKNRMTKKQGNVTSVDMLKSGAFRKGSVRKGAK